MPPSNESPEQHSLCLPQYGFGPTVEFSSLLEHNRFLFRVYTPKERSPFFDDTEPFFIAPRFDENCRNPSPGGLKNWELDGPIAISNATYRDVATHFDWTTRSLSPYISTSFSAIWSIWEAIRRYHHGVKQDVQIAVIDAHAVSQRAVTAAELMNKASPQERHEGHWKWFRFCQESQAVLIYGAIPGTAVFASVPLSDLLRRLPSYFLKDRMDCGNPFNNLAWDYTEKKPSFRVFCRDMSNRFLRLPHEERLQDATTGAVELAIAFMRPWFHREVAHGFDSAIAKLCGLAFSISQWPGQWWIMKHPEIWDLILGIVTAIAEELREKNKVKDVSRLQEAVDELEHTLMEYEDRLQHARSQAIKYHNLARSLKQRRLEEGPRTALTASVISHLPTPHASPQLDKGRIITVAQIPLPESPSASAQLGRGREIDATRIPPPNSPPTQLDKRQDIDATQIPLPEPPAASPQLYKAREIDATQIALPDSPTASPRLDEAREIDATQIALPDSPTASPRLDEAREIDAAQIPLLVPLAASPQEEAREIDAAQIPLPDSPTTPPRLDEAREIDAMKIPRPEFPLSARDRLYPKSVSPTLPTLFAITPASSPRLRPSSLLLSLTQLPSLEGDASSSSASLSPTLSALTTAHSHADDETSTVFSTSPGKENGGSQLPESPQHGSLEDPENEPKPASAPVASVSRVDDDAAVELHGLDLMGDYEWISEEDFEVEKLPVYVEAVSYIATGFFVGAMITLCLLSHRRIALLSVT